MLYTQGVCVVIKSLAPQRVGGEREYPSGGCGASGEVIRS